MQQIWVAIPPTTTFGNLRVSEVVSKPKQSEPKVLKLSKYVHRYFVKKPKFWFPKSFQSELKAKAKFLKSPKGSGGIAPLVRNCTAR
jgi:hypothetical protein